MTNPLPPLDPPPELFAERPVRSDYAQPGIPYAVRRLITVGVLLVLAAGGIYWAFMRTSGPPGEIPTIKAETGPYKQRPEQPGGIDIPHQDVQVYQALDAGGAPKPQAEHLLPPPEVPQAPSASAAAPTLSPTPPVLEVESLTPPAPAAAPAVPAVTPAVPPAVNLIAPVASPQAAAPVKAIPAVKAPPKATIAAKPKTPPKTIEQVLKDVATQGSTAEPAIQLASIQDEAAAQTDMEKLQTKYASTLGSTRLHVVKADLGAKGIYYRIQSQPLARDKAHALCEELKNLGAGCIIVRP